MKIFIAGICSIALMMSISTAKAANYTLYDATADNNVLEIQSTYIHRSTQLLPAGIATHTIDGTDSFTRIDTTGSNDEMLGYYSVAFELDRSQGVNIHFRLRVHDELTSWIHRGPFDITFNSSDDRLIRIYFTEDEIFSTDADVYRDDVVSFDTTSFVDYTLSVLGENYTLYAGTSTLLSGELISSNYGYSYIGFGDRTTGASGEVDIMSMSLSGDGVIDPLAPAVPEPLSCILILAAALFLLF